jgi:hypothetical protein
MTDHLEVDGEPANSLFTLVQFVPREELRGWLALAETLEAVEHEITVPVSPPKREGKLAKALSRLWRQLFLDKSPADWLFERRVYVRRSREALKKLGVDEGDFPLFFSDESRKDQVLKLMLTLEHKVKVDRAAAVRRAIAEYAATLNLAGNDLLMLEKVLLLCEEAAPRRCGPRQSRSAYVHPALSALWGKWSADTGWPRWYEVIRHALCADLTMGDEGFAISLHVRNDSRRRTSLILSANDRRIAIPASGTELIPARHLNLIMALYKVACARKQHYAVCATSGTNYRYKLLNISFSGTEADWNRFAICTAENTASSGSSLC